ncbi:MAG: hypothetical protein JHC32_04435, partial [Candidatus Aminicenantes bacterium]|nr:hypothetical protein [Candidatus Aminicenantes bacterium]
MKRKFCLKTTGNLIVLILLLLTFFGAELRSQVVYPAGQVQEGLKVESKILGKEVRYTIYLPPDYQTSSRRYPVV